MVCVTVDIRVIRAGQTYRYYLRQTVVGDGRRPARTPLRAAQEQAGVPVGRWMGRGLAALGLTPGQEVTEAQLRNLFGERGPTRTRTGSRPAGSPIFRPQPTIYLLWALEDEETRRVIEAAHERAIERVLEWIEDEVAVIRYGSASRRPCAAWRPATASTPPAGHWPTSPPTAGARPPPPPTGSPRPT